MGYERCANDDGIIVRNVIWPLWLCSKVSSVLLAYCMPSCRGVPLLKGAECEYLSVQNDRIASSPNSGFAMTPISKQERSERQSWEIL